MTPTDTDLSGRHTPTNKNDPCTCHHIGRNHYPGGCYVCTTPDSGCQGFTPEPTAAERDAYMAGFNAGAVWYHTGANGDPTEHAERAYTQWIEGPGEDA